MTITTLLAILQQSEYSTERLTKWYHQHQNENRHIQPSDWTPKLKLIRTITTFLFFLPLIPRITLATRLATPAEKILRSFIYRKAQNRLKLAKKQGLQVVAVAGSYGKTSTKTILTHALSLADHQVLMTPKSINTLLGISQVIEKELLPSHKLFIVELGEYYPQDIPQLLAFVQPHWGILTPIGIQHLEILGGFEQILATLEKFVEYFTTQPRHLLVAAKNRTYFSGQELQYYGSDDEDLYQVKNATVTRAGTEFTIADHHEHQDYEVFTPLLGKHQAMNMLPAVWLAQQLQLPVIAVVKKLRTMPFITRRHEPTFAEQNVLILDNSYNTNVDSIKDSLVLLNQLKPARSFIVTLGFTELGDQAEKLHFELGKQLAATVDYVGLIKAPWTVAIQAGFVATGGDPQHLVVGDNQTTTFEQLKKDIIPNSVILFEGGYQEVYV